MEPRKSILMLPEPAQKLFVQFTLVLWSMSMFDDEFKKVLQECFYEVLNELTTQERSQLEWFSAKSKEIK
jgi:hypothetical protein